MADVSWWVYEAIRDSQHHHHHQRHHHSHHHHLHLALIASIELPALLTLLLPVASLEILSMEIAVNSSSMISHIHWGGCLIGVWRCVFCPLA